MDHSEKARALFYEGYNCSQAVVCAFEDVTGIDIKTSARLSSSFGGGMGRLREVCGAVSGAFLILGILRGYDDPDLGEIVDELKKYGTVTVDTGMCIICVVGDLDWSNIGFETQVMDALKNIPVRMISYGGSNYNISFLIREEDKKRALQSLSDTLFK